jgi:DNA-binding SARP family transcriptional activator
MSTVKINLFGQLSIEWGGQVWRGPEGCKSRELLCYLLIHRSVPHNRERLASLLWEESSTAQSKKYLRQTLWQLQAAWDEHLGIADERLLLVSPERVQVNPAKDLWIDAAVFDQAFSQLRTAQPLEESSARALDAAVHMYKDDLLVGWYQDWCLYERERLQNMYLLMLDKLVDYCETGQGYLAGAEYGARILQYDPARERTHQQIMRMYYKAGDRTAALRQFDRCVEALKRELGVSPVPSTLALREQICAGHLGEFPAAASEHVRAAESSALLPSILMNLEQMQKKLVELQRELHQGIQAVEKALPRYKDRV